MALDGAIGFRVLDITCVTGLVCSAEKSISLQVLSDKLLEVFNPDSVYLLHGQVHLSGDSTSKFG